MSPRIEPAGSTARRPWSGERLTILLSIALGIVCWLGDALMDSTFFYEQSFLESAITGVSPHSLYMRSSAMVLLLAFGLVMARVISRRKHREAQLEVLQRMRDEVWRMSGPDDILHVVEALGDGLETLALPAYGYAINLVASEEPLRVLYHEAAIDDRTVSISEGHDGDETILRMWRRGCPAYRPNVRVSDAATEQNDIRIAYGESVRSVLDVPFSHGTLAINSREADAFSTAHIETLEAMAKVVSAGYRRVEDLGNLEQRNEELREKSRLLDAFQEIASASLGSLNLDEMLHRLAQHIIRAGIFRSLMVALVDERRANVEVVGSYICELGDDGLPVPGADTFLSPGPIGLKYPLDHCNITAEVARTGEMVVIDGWDDRFDSRATPAGQRHTSYFIPVKKDDQALAVLATGSLPQHKGEVLARIAAMQPLLDQVAIALEHSRLYQAAQREVAERKRLQQELVHVHRLRATGELAAGVSHNLNNILTAVLGPAQFLLRKSDDPAVRREAKAILSAGRRARDLVQRLNRAVRTGPEAPAGAVSLNDRIRDTIQMMRPRWKDDPESRGVTIDVAADLDDVPDIQGIASELDDLLTNLLLNAVEAMPEGGTITLRTRTVDVGVELTVSDNGIGMDEDTRQRIFEPFFTTKRDVGSGLGLSTVHGTVTRWGGTIEVDSTPGHGATFTLRFPAWAGEVAPADPPPTPEAEPVSGNLLIVEDDEDVCLLLDHLLSDTHTVTIARSGREAFDQLAPGRYDVALIDLGMPGLAGDQVAAHMRRVDPAMATVLITGWILEQDDFRLSWFDFHIPKPFDNLDDLESVVARAMELHNTRVRAGAGQE